MLVILSALKVFFFIFNFITQSLHFVNFSVTLAHVEHAVNILGTLNAVLKNVKMKMVAYDAAAQGNFLVALRL
ncbi:hypothetical protein CWB96_21330 [Pseudoalteromonas citrea]|uniref:Uncharacterized protein n=1 Tax=Pseudoalteromonas citrea TaxID=43655 RepID=A0A5S3XJN3_9GAMM|nr:hypothetical protein CWB97_16840 [Pseudoalteromonas citrea]TMP53431.1 hypothetical protein CWB96_21330 [Pseudoalteromonas citrea]